MADSMISVASAVIPPEAPVQVDTRPTTLKRRKSSSESSSSKRQRVGDHDPIEDSKTEASPPGQLPDTRTKERRNRGQLEERKRGQRLFGALLGTLSQSSSSTAQKKRTDIENKQRAKLQLQTEEENEKLRVKLEALTEERRKEQVKFDQQSLKIKNANLRAEAQFLQTKAEPKLFYKPWELSDSQEDQIKKQVEEAEDIIKREAEQLSDDESPAERHGKETNDTTSGAPQAPNTDKTDVSMLDEANDERESTEKSKENQDDGGEVVEGEEDTVIY